MPRAFLFLVNPALEYDPEADWAEWLPRTSNGEAYATSWNTGIRRRGMSPGDLAILVKVGVHPKGCVAVGKLVSDIYVAPHWNPRAASPVTGWVDVEWTRLIELDEPIGLDVLRGIGPHVRWTPRMSGTEIPYDIAAAVFRLAGVEP